jgi:hypothetical protein
MTEESEPKVAQTLEVNIRETHGGKENGHSRDEHNNNHTLNSRSVRASQVDATR